MNIEIIDIVYAQMYSFRKGFLLWANKSNAFSSVIVITAICNISTWTKNPSSFLDLVCGVSVSKGQNMFCLLA